MWSSNWLNHLAARLLPQPPARRRRIRPIIAAEVLEKRLYLTGAPSIVSLSLLNDTGQAGDNISEDATITGTVSSDRDVSLVNIEADYNGDGMTDDPFYADANGAFTRHPSEFPGYGQITLKFRAVELDEQTATYVYGDWASITFTHKPLDPPQISSVNLRSDTGQAGDKITEDATLVGTVTSERDVALVYVDIDLNGDGDSETSVYADASGAFRYDPSGSIGYGQYTIRFRPGELDQEGATYVYGDWTSITFTHESVDPPQMTSVSLHNDTGQLGDNITQDPTLIGTVSSERDVSQVQIEIDLDGDGFADDSAYADANGNFAYDPRGYIGYGEVTIKVRAAELDCEIQTFVYSDWVSITLTYEPEQCM